MQFPADRKYTKNDEWIKVEGDTGIIGITDFAQDQLSDIVYVELVASPGEEVAKGDSVASVESVKAAAEVYAPVSGAVTEINETLSDTPEMVNKEPFTSAWMVKLTLSNPAELDELLDAAAYEKFCAERNH